LRLGDDLVAPAIKPCAMTWNGHLGNYLLGGSLLTPMSRPSDDPACPEKTDRNDN
jgi:hypothetical protein